jgi:iron complex outermembrane receptor protein
LRDGASAQYEIWCDRSNEYHLKENTNYGSVALRSGITSEGDGEMIGVRV